MRHGFLFTGYEIDRLRVQSGHDVSWEATVMIRKLFITLAGATISDAYLQILAGQMILISALGLQAYFQPYIPDLLDVLDTLGLFSLLCTQVLSILYLYSETSERPVLPKKSLEIVVTVALFLLNAIMICIFALVWFWYCVGCDFKKLRCRKVKQMRLVSDVALIERVRLKFREGGDGSDEESPKLYWRHPVSSLAQEHPPKEVVSRTGIAEGWVWSDENGHDSWSKSTPEVVTEIPDGEKAKPGEFVCTLDPKTMSLSPLLEVPPDVMSDSGDSNDQADDHREVNGDVEMVNNPTRGAGIVDRDDDEEAVGASLNLRDEVETGREGEQQEQDQGEGARIEEAGVEVHVNSIFVVEDNPMRDNAIADSSIDAAAQQTNYTAHRRAARINRRQITRQILEKEQFENRQLQSLGQSKPALQGDILRIDHVTNEMDDDGSMNPLFDKNAMMSIDDSSSDY
jgi:hypothetical protein